MSIFYEDNKFKNLEYNYKMKLFELLQQNHPAKKAGDKKTELNDVYAIIYRIFCIPENKTYIGQTFSHIYSRNYICKWNILSRCRQHYNNKELESNKYKPLYIALTKYSSEQFLIFEEERLYEKDIRLVNQKEGEYIKKYNSIFPNGYNIEEVGKKYPKILKDLSTLYDFEIQKYKYNDTTRERRIKDVCLGSYFGLKNKKISHDEIYELLKKVDIKNITLVDSNGLRIVVKVKNEKDNIRVYFNGTKEECISLSKKLSDDIIISPSFIGKDTYKYQLKIDKVLEDKNIITTITGKSYHNESRNCDTYLIMISGNKNNRIQTLHRISFGGKSVNIKDSYKTGIDFVERIKKHINNSNIKYILENISS
jgi:hypothetical protein